jgi:phosphoglycolate phosphatase-like HAD superfamily hydrolase
MASTIDALRLGAQAAAMLENASIVFCDFDGVIKDSVAAKSDGFERLFAPFGNELARRVRQHHEAHGGLSRYEKIPIYLGWAGEPADAVQMQSFCDEFSKIVFQAVIDSPWVPGVYEYLRRHHMRQRFVLLTATPQDEILKILRALEIETCFDEVCGAPAEKAAAMASYLLRLQFVARDAVMIGDSESDLYAAEANGVAFLLRCTPINQELQQRYAGPRFEDLINE